ncbi:hypothetical protein Poly41_41560 [Novipirellula artificiosorum]|uniref:Uncharacterized protein n=1 Tax=Novipirellula artificiosorum TaxID=2528016 RepID=A0A5C6DE32_9BACT|nr:hypothetical protein Poly41_41560 [Novipirellula artificiosorum]
MSLILGAVQVWSARNLSDYARHPPVWCGQMGSLPEWLVGVTLLSSH